MLGNYKGFTNHFWQHYHFSLSVFKNLPLQFLLNKPLGKYTLDFTLAGITTSINSLHPSKTQSGISVVHSGILVGVCIYSISNSYLYPNELHI